jgi:amicyanin
MNMDKRVLTVIVVAVLLVGGAIAVIIGSRNNESTDTDNQSDSTVSQPGNESAQDMDMPAQDSQNQGTGATDSTNAASQATNQVTISSFAFSPKTITVKAGTTVTWTNNDSVEHDVVADDASADGPKSELLSKGETYSFTFQKAGTYNYHCTPHPNMQGTVVVTE